MADNLAVMFLNHEILQLQNKSILSVSLHVMSFINDLFYTTNQQSQDQTSKLSSFLFLFSRLFSCSSCQGVQGVDGALATLVLDLGVVCRAGAGVLAGVLDGVLAGVLAGVTCPLPRAGVPTPSPSPRAESLALLALGVAWVWADRGSLAPAFLARLDRVWISWRFASSSCTCWVS